MWGRVRGVVRRLALRVRARRRPPAVVVDWTAPAPPEHWAARVREAAPELLQPPAEPAPRAAWPPPPTPTPTPR